MDFKIFKTLVKSVPFGKQLPDAVYIHKSAISELPSELLQLVAKVTTSAKIPESAWTVLKLYKLDYKFALLDYPTFDNDAYPALGKSYSIDLQKLKVRNADYSSSDNPPILHRKETFVLTSHPLYETFASFTREGEAIGLYTNTRNIGFRKNWLRLIAQKGFFLDEKGHLTPLTNRVSAVTILTDEEMSIERHRTAIDRNKLSAPMQVLARHNYLSGDYSILDYGCGKGDDAREIEAHGINVCSWDPIHNPEGELAESDIVNLGFVLNVIEERDERDETLRRAYQYTKKMLVVSVMIAGDSLISKFKPYKDGIVTSINTFQKYYSQGEFRHYIESLLGESAIAVGQGIFIVFRDKLEEQLFLIERQHVRRDWTQKTQRAVAVSTKLITKDLIEKHQQLFDDYWNLTLDLGRIPTSPEFEFSDRLKSVAGSYKKAHEALVERYGEKLLTEAAKKRTEDLLVYFALGQFEKRKPYKHMPESLKRDISAFFESYAHAQERAKQLLFSVGNPLIIANACNQAYDTLNCGHMEIGHSFIFHKNYLGDCPPELRVYVGCALQLYGEIEDVDLIKAHFTSGKVTFLKYQNWDGEQPKLAERIKVKLRDQDVDFFDYRSGEFEDTQPLVKSKYLSARHSNKEKA